MPEPHSPCTFTSHFPFQPYRTTRTLPITSNHAQHHSSSLLNPSLEPAQPLFNSGCSSSTATHNTTKRPPRAPHNRWTTTTTIPISSLSNLSHHKSPPLLHLTVANRHHCTSPSHLHDRLHPQNSFSFPSAATSTAPLRTIPRQPHSERNLRPQSHLSVTHLPIHVATIRGCIQVEACGSSAVSFRLFDCALCFNLIMLVVSDEFSLNGGRFKEEFEKAVSVVGDTPSKGMFIDSCFTHCQTLSTETWFKADSPHLANTIIGKAAGDWFYDRSPFSHVDCNYPCNPTCQNSVSDLKDHPEI
ncbi:unnamed protein product [Sphenostylis stenocarpa]|uniref:Pectin acetylesterase n=1 Tax=Sphenostylis stenocarpa TaxID=92480 RepID=A0AA86SFZ0_9FABA|nr:unnamed protein product [Sphenostylis stenocarpa]